MKQNNKLINFDSIYSTKVNDNCYNISYKTETLTSVKKIFLKSVEIPICVANVRSPYNIFYYTIRTINNITTQYSFNMPDKTYTSIFTLLTDLNAAIVTNIQPKMQTNEIAPILTINNSELNKINLSVITNSSTLSFINNGFLYYYLGYNVNNVKITTSNILLQKTTLFSFSNVYNLSFDTYYNLNFNNISSINKNNHSFFSDFKLAINSISNTVFYANELTSYSQHILINDKNLTLSKIDITIVDRYNNIIFSPLDWSLTLEFEFY